MSTTKPTIKNQVNVITLKCAKDWHTAFLEQNKNGFAPMDLPSSIVIPFADIEQIVHDFKIEAAKTINGVRIYFIIKPVETSSGRPKISVILVPTTGPLHNNTEGVYNDMIVNATLKAGAPKHPYCNPEETGTPKKKKNEETGTGRMARVTSEAVDADEGEEGYSSIYDFTRPCPPYCSEPESELASGS